jgi:hypothetical protein
MFVQNWAATDWPAAPDLQAKLMALNGAPVKV